ncbi:chromosome segregation protein SMC [Corallincola luteus]|uniref:Chromosome partition protein Smc n=1 Tax=Corallincola luteus TaxID=1775177 RepID=A0ABY2AT41_9GAMM|nr:chromosome segregation protein SMC [Corallincola luteus]TCI05457.1 chromosome segregation protein SMC [Corallincola luteus]
MRLKQIKLAGFKSFVDPTTVPFPGNMTAVVGPNGCGKSNTIDAVRWVLGESSAKNLRGDAMTDVIFNGAASRKPVSQASVELVFENHQGRIGGNYANFAEISVKRVVTRDAVSTYLLNGSKCRKRDITDLFLGTGLGPRSYAIIEQGMISRLIESKPQELRIFIEEAAGISKYKERRRETENRLKHTRENMERLADVRDELGKQLEKLQRQAVAAKRFKELKARERQLKSELYAIRWYQLNEQLNRCEREQAEQETALEQFNAQQQGKESRLIALQTEREQLKSDQQHSQQKLFQLTTEITRLEQQMMASRQQRVRLEDELALLAAKQEELELLIASEVEQQQISADELAAQQEAALLLDEEIEQAQNMLDDAESAVIDWQRRWQASEQAEAAVRQQQALLESKLNHLVQLSAQQGQRLQQVSDELVELDDAELTLELNRLAESLAMQTEQLAEQQLLLAESESAVGDAKMALTDLDSKVHQNELALAGLQAQWQALDSQLSQAAESEALPDGVKPLYQAMTVAPEWTLAVEKVLASFSQAHLCDALAAETAGAAGRLLQLSSGAVVASHLLASKVDGEAKYAVANLLRGIECVDTAEQAWQRQPTLTEGQTVISRCGVWLGQHWLHPDVDMVAGPIKLRQQQLMLAEQISPLQVQLTRDKQELQQAQQRVARCQQQFTEQQGLCRRIDAEVATLRQQRHFADQQHSERQLRKQRLQQEQTLLQEQVAEHQAEQELLLAQQLEVAERLDDMGQQDQLRLQKESFDQQVSQAKLQVQQRQQQRQGIALRQENLKAQLTALSQAQQRTEKDRHEALLRKQQLVEELQQHETPDVDQAEQLEILLAERLELSSELELLTEQLSGLDEQTRELEMGQRDVLQHLEKQRVRISDLQIEAEGFRVRARSVLETLHEMQANLKELLVALPDSYSEDEWQQQLEKTTQAISRLGAINLAAIEEYEQQAERKQYLDSQNEDLEGAVGTLETAIRKIDRETRQRFRETYEQVNTDLQHLFPKVFGGGSAHLALTDDDLLETGVTIMAQPPGKKNSTIHLLSGGEKALTALSLVFAIFRLNPAPFCMLDEVDAPLDDANVGRFCNLVKEMSETVQFIFISHNKVSMEMASHLTGVTMQEPGVSRLVAVDVEQAVALAELG